MSTAKIRIQKYLVRFGSFFTHLSYCLYRQFLCRQYSKLLESEQFKKCLQIYKHKLLWKVSPKTLHSFFFFRHFFVVSFNLSEEEVIALVPWIDFMNHDPDSKAYVSATQEVSGAMVLLKTDRSYKAWAFGPFGKRWREWTTEIL